MAFSREIASGSKPRESKAYINVLGHFQFLEFVFRPLAVAMFPLITSVFCLNGCIFFCYFLRHSSNDSAEVERARLTRVTRSFIKEDMELF